MSNQTRFSFGDGVTWEESLDGKTGKTKTRKGIVLAQIAPGSQPNPDLFPTISPGRQQPTTQASVVVGNKKGTVRWMGISEVVANQRVTKKAPTITRSLYQAHMRAVALRQADLRSRMVDFVEATTHRLRRSQASNGSDVDVLAESLELDRARLQTLLHLLDYHDTGGMEPIPSPS